ncbi:ABC-F family ATP-binding cassette domain-containing protein [Devosia sp. ZB163]|uniref:ABC-F family ATP-binding cassette domain-containing protein n=1 Tax=Devosia sp. ZB163 TaxID=3025938 RepID=UPI002360C7F2|nr:ABC-F family ATP-binding cassette domain-containing protein [Devosia sp. ZB163]MDC9824369.1 ABC-F family ATP-binding cassette domain-containing protein [Devosia sp. ZB163]
MPGSISLKAASYKTPSGVELFSNLDLAFGPLRTGLIGRNGVGKSTLLKLITGELAPASGEVAVTGTIGLLRQTVQHGDASVRVGLGCADELDRLDRLEAGTGSLEDATDADWTLPARIENVLADVGLPSLDMQRPVSSLSGGQRTRLSLAALLLEQPDMLLLDEPTNNLDADGRAAVAAMLKGWRGGAIVVSHDRALLREMDQIIELTTIGANVYGGNWDLYRERKAAELAAAEHDLANAERTLGEIDRKTQAMRERKARKDSAGAKKAARGDIPRILLGGMKNNSENTSGEQARLGERRRATASVALAEAKAEIEVLQPMSVKLEPSGLSRGTTVLQLDRLTGGPIPGQPIIRDLGLKVTGPERVAITGPNGTGKTTLLRLITGDLGPEGGAVRITPRHALLDQQVGILDPTETIRENYLRLNPGDNENAARAALARFMFRSDAALKSVWQLSGGEMLRAGLACTIGSGRPPELLILDEPTNHLDIHAIEAVEAGLRAYDGALLVVSHDRAFLEAIGIERELELGGPGFSDAPSSG